MSRQNQRYDKTLMKESTTGVHNSSGSSLSTGGWRRRSLFSTERLDLILSNMRRNLDRSDDVEQCKQISHHVNYSRDVEQRQQQQQQQQSGAEDRCSKQKTMTPLGHVLKTAAGGGDVQLDNEPNKPPASQNAAESLSRYVNNTDSSHHNDVTQTTTVVLDDVKLTILADRNSSDGSQIKKSVSFRAESKKHPSGNADGDKYTMSCMYRSLPRPRQLSGQPQQHNQSASTIAPAPLSQTSPNQNRSGRDRPSVKTVLRDPNNKQDSGSKWRSQSSGPGKRSTYVSGLVTQRDSGFSEVLNSSGSCSPTERSVVERCPRAEHHCRHPKSINWFVDLNDFASTEFRQPTSLGTSSLRRHQGNCRIGAGTKLGQNAVNDGKTMLELESFSRTTHTDASGRQGRATTRPTLSLDQFRHNDVTDATSTAVSTSTSTSTLAELGQKCTLLPGTWSPKANRTSELRTSKNPDSEDPVFYRSSTSQFRRSTTRPKCSETFIHAESAVKPAERDVSCGSTRTRSISLSEQYRMLIGGDWFDNFSTSSAVANQHKLTPVNGYHKPLAQARQLKPDFVIYV